MHKYFVTQDARVIAIRDTGVASAIVAIATAHLVRVPAPKNAKSMRLSGAIPTCRVTPDGRIGAL